MSSRIYQTPEQRQMMVEIEIASERSKSRVLSIKTTPLMKDDSTRLMAAVWQCLSLECSRNQRQNDVICHVQFLLRTETRVNLFPTVISAEGENSAQVETI